MKGIIMEKQIVKEIQNIIENNIPKWMSIKDCVRVSGLSESSIRRAISMGALKANKKGRWIIKASWLEKYLTS